MQLQQSGLQSLVSSLYWLSKKIEKLLFIKFEVSDANIRLWRLSRPCYCMRTKGINLKLTTCTNRKNALLIGSYYRNLWLKICNHLTNQCLKYSSQININKTVKYFREISTLVISTGPWTRESKINHTVILSNLVSLLNCYGVGHVNTLPTYDMSW